MVLGPICGLRSPLYGMQTGAVLFSSLFDRQNSSAKVSELNKFLLYCFERLLPLAVSDLGVCVVTAFPSILLV